VTSGGIVASIVWDDAALESIVMSDGFLEQARPRRSPSFNEYGAARKNGQKAGSGSCQHDCTYVRGSHFLADPKPPSPESLDFPWPGHSKPKNVSDRSLRRWRQGIFDFGEAVGARSTR